MTAHLTCPVTDLRAGDQWYTDKDTVRIDNVEILGDGGLPGQSPMVRIYGRITRGWGRSLTKQRTWTFHYDQTLEIIRE